MFFTILLMALAYAQPFKLGYNENDEKQKDLLKKVDTVVVRDEYTMGLKAPKGWIVDRESGRHGRICSMYYEQGYSMDNAPAIIYARIARSDSKGKKGVMEIIDAAKRMLSRSPTLKLEKLKEYTTPDGDKYFIQYYLNGPKPNSFEAGAYLPFGTHFVQAVYSATDEKKFYANIRKFHEFIDQIRPYSTNMHPLSGSCLVPSGAE